ncbi:hypothetical protein BGW38_000391, partial [Lunasporangiospora selenospora]
MSDFQAPSTRLDSEQEHSQVQRQTLREEIALLNAQTTPYTTTNLSSTGTLEQPVNHEDQTHLTHKTLVETRVGDHSTLFSRAAESLSGSLTLEEASHLQRENASELSLHGQPAYPREISVSPPTESPYSAKTKTNVIVSLSSAAPSQGPESMTACATTMLEGQESRVYVCNTPNISLSNRNTPCPREGQESTSAVCNLDETPATVATATATTTATTTAIEALPTVLDRLLEQRRPTESIISSMSHSSSHRQRVRPLSVTIDLSSSARYDPPAYEKELPSSSAQHDNHVGPSSASITSAQAYLRAHQRSDSASQSHFSVHEGPSIQYQPPHQPLQLGAHGALGGRTSPVSLPFTPSIAAASLVQSGHRRPFLEEDELPEYIMLSENGPPFLIPANRSITYTVIPSQGPEEFRQQAEPQQDQQDQQQHQNHCHCSHHHGCQRQASQYPNHRLDRAPSGPSHYDHLESSPDVNNVNGAPLETTTAGPASSMIPSANRHDRQPTGAGHLEDSVHQHEQSTFGPTNPSTTLDCCPHERKPGPWTLEYWVGDSIIYLCYLMDPKLSAVTELVPRTVPGVRTTWPSFPVPSVAAPDASPPAPPASSTLDSAQSPPNPVPSEPTDGSTGGNDSTSPQVREAGPASARSSWLGRASSSVGGLVSRRSHNSSQFQQEQAGEQEHEPAHSPLASSDPSTIPGAIAESDSAAVPVATGTDEIEDEEEEMEGMERVPTGHIRGRPPPLHRTSRNHNLPIIFPFPMGPRGLGSMLSDSRRQQRPGQLRPDAAQSAAPARASPHVRISESLEEVTESNTSGRQADNSDSPMTRTLNSNPTDNAAGASTTRPSGEGVQERASTSLQIQQEDISNDQPTGNHYSNRASGSTEADLGPGNAAGTNMHSSSVEVLSQETSGSNATTPEPRPISPYSGSVRITLPSIQHIQINDGYPEEEADIMLAHTLTLQARNQPTSRPSTRSRPQQPASESTSQQRTSRSNTHSSSARGANAFNNALSSDFFKHPSFAFVSAEDPQTWLWWSSHHDSDLQKCRQEGPNEEVMMWWRTRADFQSKEIKAKRQRYKTRRNALKQLRKQERQQRALRREVLERQRKILAQEREQQQQHEMEAMEQGIELGQPFSGQGHAESRPSSGSQAKVPFPSPRDQSHGSRDASKRKQKDKIETRSSELKKWIGKLYHHWVRLLSVESKSLFTHRMEIVMRVRGLYYAWHEDDYEPLVPSASDPQAPLPLLAHRYHAFPLTPERDGRDERSGQGPTAMGYALDRPMDSESLTRLLDPRLRARKFLLVRDDSQVNGERVKGGPVAEVWMTEEDGPDPDVPLADYFTRFTGLTAQSELASTAPTSRVISHGGAPLSIGTSSGAGPSTLPTSAMSGSPPVQHQYFSSFVPQSSSSAHHLWGRSRQRSHSFEGRASSTSMSSLRSNNGNTFMTQVSAATGGPVRSTVASTFMHPVPSGRSYSTTYSIRGPRSGPVGGFGSIGGAGSSSGGGGGGGGGGGFSGSAYEEVSPEPSIYQPQQSIPVHTLPSPPHPSMDHEPIPTEEPAVHSGHCHDCGRHNAHQRRPSRGRSRSLDSTWSSRSSDSHESRLTGRSWVGHHGHCMYESGGAGACGESVCTGACTCRSRCGEGDDSSSSSFPRGLRRRRCLIRVLDGINHEVETFALSTGPRLPELFALYSDQALPGPSRATFMCSVFSFVVVFMIAFV